MLLRWSGRVESIRSTDVRTRAPVRAGVLTLTVWPLPRFVMCSCHIVPRQPGIHRLVRVPSQPVSISYHTTRFAAPPRVAPMPPGIASGRIGMYHVPHFAIPLLPSHPDFVPTALATYHVSHVPVHPVPSRIRFNRIGLIPRVSRSALSRPIRHSFQFHTSHTLSRHMATYSRAAGRTGIRSRPARG